jgi:hypothetical protein
VVGMPTRFAMDRVNRAVDIAHRTGEQARDVVGDVAGKVVRLGSGTREVAAAGRDAALRRAERLAARDGADAMAGVVHETRAELGGLEASELPIPHYEEMTAQAAIAALRELTTASDVNVMIVFEKGHKNRSGVISAAQTRYAALAKDVTGVE